MARTVLVETRAGAAEVPDLAVGTDDPVRYFGGLIRVALMLRSGARPLLPPDALRARWLAEIERGRRRAELAGYARATIDEITWAVAAMLDAAVVAAPSHAAAWAAHPLEVALFGTASAGQDLHARIQAARQRRDRAVLGVYRLVLLGGFEGHRLDDHARARLLRDLDRELGLDRLDGVSALFPSPEPALPVGRSLAPHVRAVAVLLIALAAGLFAFLRVEAAEVAALAEAVARGLPGGAS